MLKRHEATVEERSAPLRPLLSEPPITGAGTSILVTLMGAAGLIVSAFLEWIRPDRIEGARLSVRAFFDTSFSTSAGFLRSAGFAVILVGLLAILGLAFRTGWIVRLAGALGIIGFALFAITLKRMDAQLPESIGVGMWVMLGASLLSLFGGFFATRPRIVVTNAPVPS